VAEVATQTGRTLRAVYAQRFRLGLNDGRKNNRVMNPAVASSAEATIKRFTVTSEGTDRFGLAKLAQAYINEQWMAAHMFLEEAVAAMSEQFRLALLHDLELIEVRCEEVQA
jgi:hypothetical protein